MGNLITSTKLEKETYPPCDYCGEYPSDNVPVLLVHHPGKLNGKHVCYTCLSDRRYRTEQYIRRRQDGKKA